MSSSPRSSYSYSSSNGSERNSVSRRDSTLRSEPRLTSRPKAVVHHYDTPSKDPKRTKDMDSRRWTWATTILFISPKIIHCTTTMTLPIPIPTTSEGVIWSLTMYSLCDTTTGLAQEEFEPAHWLLRTKAKGFEMELEFTRQRTHACKVMLSGLKGGLDYCYQVSLWFLSFCVLIISQSQSVYLFTRRIHCLKTRVLSSTVTQHKHNTIYIVWTIHWISSWTELLCFISHLVSYRHRQSLTSPLPV